MLKFVSMLKIVVVFLLVLNSVQSESRASLNFQKCAERCTSADTRERIKCKIECSEEMKRDYAREMEEDSKRRREEEKEDGVEVKKCSDQCPSSEQDPINGVKRQTEEEEVEMDNDEVTQHPPDFESDQSSSMKEEL